MKKIVILLTALLSGFILSHAQIGSPLIIASYNIRYDNPGDGMNSWSNRKEEVKSLIRFHEFDIFGTQEGLIGQLQYLLEASDFAFCGAGRDDGKYAGEHSAIFYRKKRFRLLKNGDFWLSETPGKPSYGWDATSHKRICSWAKFHDLKTRKRFYFFSVHFDHRGSEARKESAKLMVNKIREIAGTYPVICVGDFNSTPETEQIQTMKNLLKDSYEVSEMPPYGPVGTSNGFAFNAPMEKRIDYIFVSDHISVLKYGVLTDNRNQRFPSDHQPVVSKVMIY